MNQTIRRLPAVLPALVFMACTTQPRATSETPVIITEAARARIDTVLQALVDEQRVAGISALVYEKGQEVYFNAAGYADREAGVPMDRNTIVRIFSMTKPVTGVALMQLYEQGAFKLEDPLSKYVPAFSDMEVFVGTTPSGDPQVEPASRPITILDLGRHTSGLMSFAGKPPLDSMIRVVRPMDPNNTLQGVAEKLASLPLAFHPGAEWGYGPSVDVQAYLVEKLSGKPFAQYLQENIFTPLGMDETSYFIPEDRRNRFAAVYQREEGVLTRVPDDTANALNTRRWPLTPGGYGLAATIDDYMKFARMLVNEGTLDGAKILNPETVALMATNHLPDSVTELRWLTGNGQVGFGFDFAVRIRPPADAEENNGVVGEFFWNGAATTLFWVDPRNELAAVLFLQVFPFDMTVHNRFRDAVYGAYQP